MVLCLVQSIAAIKAIVGSKTAIPAPALSSFATVTLNTYLRYKALHLKRGLNKGCSQGFPIFGRPLFAQLVFSGASWYIVLCAVPQVKVRSFLFFFLHGKISGFFLFWWQSRRKIDSRFSILVRPLHHFKGRISFPFRQVQNSDRINSDRIGPDQLGPVRVGSGRINSDRLGSTTT